jgi:hypothetical protein
MCGRVIPVMVNRAKVPAIAAAAVLLFFCGPQIPKSAKAPLSADMVSATLSKDNGSLALVLRNNSPQNLTICKKNFYTPFEFLEIRKFPDSSEAPQDKIFLPLPSRFTRPEVTLSDFITLGPGKEFALPLDLRSIRNGCALGDTVLLAASFKNVDPFLCSSLNVDKCDKATQEYCRLLHCIPRASCLYWSGDVRTPFSAVHLCTYAPPRVRKASPVVVVRRSVTHPLKRKVF